MSVCRSHMFVNTRCRVHSLYIKKDEELVFRVFGTSLPILRLRRPRNFWAVMCDRTAGFKHVLSVSVVPSMSVESATESNDVLMTSFALSLSCTMRSAMSVLLEETAFGGHASVWSADPSIADFFEHLTSVYPRSMIHAGLKVPAVLKDWQELHAKQAVFFSSFHKV